jgi:hypothetical protein
MRSAWLPVLIVLIAALNCVRASWTQDMGMTECVTDTCCRAMYRKGMTSVSWCVADIVADTPSGCRVVPRCESDEVCMAEDHVCVSAAHAAAVVANTTANTTCTQTNCNLCNGEACSNLTHLCERIQDPVVCPEGTQCFALNHSCIPQTCTTDAQCTNDDGVFCNGTPKCNLGTNTCVVVPPCESSAPLCSETFRKCNAICASDADCTLPAQTFCDNWRPCDAEADFCLSKALPRCNPANETCDPLNKICVLAPPAPVPGPQRLTLLDGNVLAKWVLIIWLFTFVGAVLCAVIIWLSRARTSRKRSNSLTDAKPAETRRRR